jgi:hypothetical protein
MNKKLAAEHIDFADSEYVSLNITEDDVLIIYLRSWQEKTLKITFSNTLQFLYTQEDAIQDIYEILDVSPFLEKALSKRYIKLPLDHPFKLFQIEDIDDFPFIQVVAESVHVVKE